jgi:hypothetical protein
VGITRKAVMQDFQTEDNMSVDVEISEYRQTFETLCTRFRWNRVATRIRTGIPAGYVGRFKGWVPLKSLKVDATLGQGFLPS